MTLIQKTICFYCNSSTNSKQCSSSNTFKPEKTWNGNIRIWHCGFIRDAIILQSCLEKIFFTTFKLPTALINNYHRLKLRRGPRLPCFRIQMGTVVRKLVDKARLLWKLRARNDPPKQLPKRNPHQHLCKTNTNRILRCLLMSPMITLCKMIIISCCLRFVQTSFVKIQFNDSKRTFATRVHPASVPHASIYMTRTVIATIAARCTHKMKKHKPMGKTGSSAATVTRSGTIHDVSSIKRSRKTLTLGKLVCLKLPCHFFHT